MKIGRLLGVQLGAVTQWPHWLPTQQLERGFRL